MAVASDRLWRHFTPAVHSPIVVERGEGCYIWDTEGNRYLDALAALYCVNIGYGPWPEIAEAARAQVERLPFFTNWVGFATPPALELADRVLGGDARRVRVPAVVEVTGVAALVRPDRRAVDRRRHEATLLPPPCESDRESRRDRERGCERVRIG